ncbi:MAG: hypothetical protein GC179_09370 [Anaerolineaceae bacterium]|nr:hypothetical protein [Anaerolineaceae bacterium]
MLPSKLQESFYNPYYEVQSRVYIYYSRYPAVKPTKTRRSLRRRLRLLSLYLRLVFIGVIMTIVGGLFPLILSYELFFKQMVFNACDTCNIIGASPSFQYDFMVADIIAVFGFMMPILIIIVFIKIMRSRLMRHELFH